MLSGLETHVVLLLHQTMGSLLQTAMLRCLISFLKCNERPLPPKLSEARSFNLRITARFNDLTNFGRSFVRLSMRFTLL